MATKRTTTDTQDTQGIDTNAQIIDQAIKSKQMVDFLYHGYHRVGEPHILGIMNGTYQMLLYQTGGASSSGELGWRLFKLKDIKMLSVLKDTFKGARHTTTGIHAQWEKHITVVEPE